MTDQAIITATQKWLTSFVIAYNICPFAQREQQNDSIRYQVSYDANLEPALEILMLECAELDSKPESATSLIIYPNGFADFDDYLDLVAIAEQLLTDRGYEGVYQLASFHPNYCFEGSDEQDPANYTNRSPYPMLHIIRETSLTAALSSYPDPENIPERNIKITRELGVEKLISLLTESKTTT
jgi:hypothetical protein